jgi:hypothetical protein
MVSVAAIGLAAALVWYFRPHDAPSVSEAPHARAPAEVDLERLTDHSRRAAPAPAEPLHDEPDAADALPPERAPLPGEAPATPMAQALADHQQNLIIRDPGAGNAIPPELAEGEREFSAEPVDSTWAPGAEANLLSAFAQMPGLELVDLQVHCRSTMCRVQLTQSIAFSPGSRREPPFKIGEEVGMKPRWMMTVSAGAAPARPPQVGDPPLLLKSIAYLWRDGFSPERETGGSHEQD